jgi:hypothetical protein
MQQVGQADPKVTLSIYVRVICGGEGEKERLKTLCEDSDWAPVGTGEPEVAVGDGRQLSFESL